MIFGMVLAGGRSVRFGREKAAAKLQDRPLIERPLSVLQAGCDRVAINAKPGVGAAAFAKERGLHTLADAPGDPLGPLSGVKAGLSWCCDSGGYILATAPCDTPFLPDNLIPRLLAALDEDHPVAVARTSEGLQSLCAVWRCELHGAVALALTNGIHPPVRQLLQHLGAAEVLFDDPHAFTNINTQPDFALAKARLLS